MQMIREADWVAALVFCSNLLLLSGLHASATGDMVPETDRVRDPAPSPPPPRRASPCI